MANMKNSSLSETAILAGGCFWGMEELIRHRDGILATRVGYTGGDLKNPTYEQVKTGHTHHAEAIEIQFDPTRIHYDQILEFFFQIHDPTTQNRQGNDRGSQYRSAIFYRDETQKQIAEARIQAMNASHQWPGPIVTEIVKAKEFYPAEAEHQNYLQHYPNGYSCHFLRPEWHL